MKIIAQSDPHANIPLYRDTIRYMKNNTEYDLFIGLGDYINQNYFANLVTKIKTKNKFFIQGNRDIALRKLPYIKEFDVKEIDGYTFILAGSSMSRKVKEKILDACEDKAGNEIIVCTHVPPHGIRDKTTHGNNAGSPEFKEIIEEVQPLLWLCGHIHEARGIEKFEETTVINAAASNQILGYDIEINDKQIKNIEEIHR